MTCIYNAVELLEKMNLSQDQKWCVDVLKMEAEALLALIDEACKKAQS